MCNSFTYYDAADIKSHDTITVCREALGLSRQNGCFCRNFSLGSITSYRAAEEQSVSTQQRFCFMTELQPRTCTTEALWTGRWL